MPDIEENPTLPEVQDLYKDQKTGVKTRKVRKERPPFQKAEWYLFGGVTLLLVIGILVSWGSLIQSAKGILGVTVGTWVDYIWVAILFLLLLDGMILYLLIRKINRRGVLIMWGLMLIFALSGIGMQFGYSMAIAQRQQKENDLRQTQAVEHFMAAEQALAEGKYEQARIQYTYVLQLVPNFPSAMERLVEVQLQVSALLTPTVTPTPTIQPTPDTRGQEDMFSQAIQHMLLKEWQEAFDDLEALRNLDPEYRVVEMDGLYYQVLRTLGYERIFGNTERGIAGGNLEEGIYYLNLAEKFAPLDTYANQAREWARRYLNAAAYWDINWERVVTLFQAVVNAYPNMTDVNLKTAAWRYITGMINYADQFAASGDACSAANWYQQAYDANSAYNRLRADEVEYLTTSLQDVYTKCYPPTPTSPPVIPTPEVTPTEGTPTEPTP